ncbi:MAG: Omp28-related outer membrane protein [Bacteroidia bacterium]|nr:Omp28-related outer membrane protein [Bacteroidia bacterium]
MRIKNIQLLFILSGLSVLFFSCDKVDPPYTTQTGVTQGDSTCSFPTDASPVYRKILVEDYTGHLCGNCPFAANAIYGSGGLKILHGDTVISMGVHASPGSTFTETCPPHPYPNGAQAFAPVYTEDFRTPAGETWLTDFGVSSNPKGMVSRTVYNANLVLSPTAWNSALMALSVTPAAMKIQILNTYTDANGDLNTCIKTSFLAALNGDYKLSVVLTEDSVKGWQEDYTIIPSVAPLFQNDTNYIHRHVLRGAINASYGEVIKTGGAAVGDTVVKSYKINLNSLPVSVNPLNPVLNINRCSVIAFVYDATTKEVLQVEEAKVR